MGQPHAWRSQAAVVRYGLAVIATAYTYRMQADPHVLASACNMSKVITVASRLQVCSKT